NARQLVEVLNDTIRCHTLAEWQKRLASFEGVWDAALSPAEIIEDPQVAANGYLADVRTPDGATFGAVSAPIQYGGMPVGSVSAMPEVGQHTEEILLELGFTWEEIAELKTVGAIT